MSSKRAQKTFVNFIWSICNIAVTSLFPFIVRTMMVYFIGIEYTGVSSLFTSTLQVLNIADFGFGKAIGFYLYEPIARHNKENIEKILNLLRKTYRIIGTIMLVVGVVIAFFLPYFVKDGAYPDGLNIYFIYFVYLLYTISPYLGFGYIEPLFRADLKLDSIAKIGIISSGIMYTLQVIAIISLKNYYMYTLLLLIQPIIYNISVYSSYRSIYSEYKCRGKVGKEFIEDFQKKIIAIALVKIRNVSRNSFDSIFISVFLGLTVLARYQNYYQIMIFLILISGTIRDSVKASLGNSLVLESEESNYGVIKQYTYVLYLFITIGVSGIICLIQPFMKLWMGETNLLPNNIVFLFVIYFVVLVIADVAVLLRDAAGSWSQGKYVAITEVAFNLILNLALVKFLGIAGVVIATIITVACINIPFEYHLVFSNLFPGKLKQYIIIHAKEMCLSIVSSGITYIIVEYAGLKDDAWIYVILKAVGVVIVSFTCWIIFHYKNSDVGIISVLKKMVGEIGKIWV